MQSVTIHIFSFALLLLQAAPSNTIIGKWEGVEATGHVGDVLEFRRGGFFSEGMGISSSGNYKLDGKRVLIEETSSDLDNRSEALELRIERNALFLKYDDGEVRLRRLHRRKPAAPAIVGKWIVKGAFFHGGENGLWTIEFTKDGRVRMTMRREPEKGRFKINGNRLITKVNGESSVSSFRFEDGFLILMRQSKPVGEEKYKRVDRLAR